MLTELCGLGAAESPLTSLGEYPACMEGTEFEYIESPLADPYCGGPLQPPSPPPSPPKLGGSLSCLPSLLYPPATGDLQQPYLDCTSHYENDLVSLDRITSYEDDIKYEDSVKYDDLKYEDMMADISNSPILLPETSQPLGGSDLSPGEYSPTETMENVSFGEDTSPLPEENCVGKGKVSDLQRTALDAIFYVTDRPSRGLVIHIASELHLHHVTVKNFFSNARRRVRRAAARLNDPERSRRENRRRKEKRRLAALAAAAAADGQYILDTTGVINVSQKNQAGAAVDPAKEAATVSPQRRALMEKLADKVQRSAAQRNMAALPDTATTTTNNIITNNTTISNNNNNIIITPVISNSNNLITTSNGITINTICSNMLISSNSDTDNIISSDSFLSNSNNGGIIISEFSSNVFNNSNNSSNSSVLSDGSGVISESISISNSLGGSDNGEAIADLTSWPQTLLNETLEYQPDPWELPQLY